MGKFGVLDNDIVNEIATFFHKKWEDEKLNVLFPNIILRSDVLQILDRYCTVIYYPLPDEGNNGFHISNIPDLKGENQHFVYINTAQSLEKQVFTAAHELGHAWDVDKFVIKSFEKNHIERIKQQEKKYGTDGLEERIVNRFAAEMLMPEEVFRTQYENELNKIEKSDKGIPLSKFLKVVAFLMNFFLVPMKSVIIRMAELKILNIETANILTSEKELLLASIVKKEIERINREGGYTDLYIPTKKKYISGLVEMLEMAERTKSVSEEKIKAMRERFELEPETDEPELSRPITLE